MDFGIDLDQFRQRVHEPPPDGDGAPDRHVLVGELLAGHFRGGVDGRAAFVDHDHGDAGRQLEAPDEILGLAAGGAVADRDGLDLELLAQSRDLGPVRRARLLALVQVDHVRVFQLSLPVETDHFAARAEAGVDRQHVLAAQRRRQQQFPQVLRKDPDGLLVGPLLGLHQDFRLHRWGEEPLVAVEGGLADQVCTGRLALDEQRFQRPRRLLFGGTHLQAQEPFAGTTPHGQNPVRRRLGDRLFPVEVVLELAPFGLFARHDLGAERSFRMEELANAGPGRLFFVDPFGDDVLRAGQGRFDRFDALVRIDEGVCLRERIGGRVLRQNQLGQRFQPLFAGHRGARTPFRAVG